MNDQLRIRIFVGRIVCDYTNHRGVTTRRSFTPSNIFWGSTEWHREPQWIMHAYDQEKKAWRDFAMKDMGNVEWRD